MIKTLSDMGIDLSGKSTSIAQLMDLGFDKSGAEFVSQFITKEEYEKAHSPT